MPWSLVEKMRIAMVGLNSDQVPYIQEAKALAKVIDKALRKF